MSRRKTKPEEIKNPEHYFKKYMAFEMKSMHRKNAVLRDMEDSLEQRSECSSFEYSIATNKNGELFSMAESRKPHCDWIKDYKLLTAVEELSDRERLMLKLLFYDARSQAEIAKEFSISQQAVSKMLKRIFAKLKKSFGA